MQLFSFGLGWLWTIFSSFWFWLDKAIYDLIGSLYTILMGIARVSILSQGTIRSISDRIQILLGVFMLFKVSLSLIMYVVNPDDFSDKSKGVSKLAVNTIISLVLLALVPYIFNMAFRLQNMILEDNTLARIIFGNTNKGKGGYQYNILTAGDKMKYEIVMPFLQPNTGVEGMESCVNITNDNGKFNDACLKALKEHASEDEKKDDKYPNINNYKTGVENSSFGLVFRLSTITVTVNEDKDTYLFDYKWPITTVCGVVTCLLLISFCIDVAARAVKLSFLQLIAPIPIISYMDPKSGKDGLFGKWAKMCGTTYVSLFVRLLVLYLGIFIISNIDDIVDAVDGSKVTDPIIKVFVIIGVLFFVKQLPQILNNLGIKMDGDGKFTLNPLKKVEENSAGGKRITGAMAGFAVGALGNKGNPFKAVGGMFRGAAGNQGLSGSAKHQADVNKQLRQAKLDGSTIAGRMNARWTNLTGAKGFNNVEKTRKEIDALQKFADSGKKIENRAIKKIEDGEAGNLSTEYFRQKNEFDANKAAFEDGNYKNVTYNGQTATSRDQASRLIAQQQADVGNYLHETAAQDYMTEVINGSRDDPAMSTEYKNFQKYASAANKKAANNGADLHKQVGKTLGEITEKDIKTRDVDTANQANQKYVEAAKIKK